MTTRVGIGYDSHRFVPGGSLILGGIRIPADVSLHGHSDADAVAHAVTDAVLGAAAAGDIGALFPNTDDVNVGRDSIEMLRIAVAKVAGMGYTVGNLDITIVAEFPHVGRHVPAMREVLAEALGIAAGAVSVKGKSNEGMGWIGHGEGLACIAVATLTREP